MINPLLFCPSPRAIPEVIETWEQIPYDKFIVKNRLEPRAYKDGRDFFLDHDEYTHLVVCPDDMDVTKDSFFQLLSDIRKRNYPALSGIANIEEQQPTVYSAKPKKVLDYSLDHAPNTYGTFYSSRQKPFLPKWPIFSVGFAGFACQFIRRDLMKKISFTGSCNGGKGCMDWKFAQECEKLGVRQMVDQRAFFYHRRMAQYHQVKAWKNGPHPPDEGYTILLKPGDKYPTN